ncbi:MAG: PKD domain-containing protein, partial [Gammaproteobacteria bacterium]
VLDESTLGIQTGDQLANILSATRTSAPDGNGGQANLQTSAPGGAGLTQDEAGAVLAYTVVGNATCAGDAAPVPHLTADVLTGAAPLTVNFDGSGSTPQPGQARVVYYRFNFGDGTSTPWQTAPAAEHAYQSPDSYVATLEVADSRGLVSTSESTVTVVAQAPSSGD